MRRGSTAIVLFLTAWIASAMEARAASCAPGPNALCLLGRFRVEVIWRGADGIPTAARALPLPGTDGGAFWFFSPDNPELAIKIVDGRAVNGFFWFFYGGLTHLGYRIDVTDTASDAAKSYEVPSGPPASAADTAAFRGTGSLQADLLAFAADELTALFDYDPDQPPVGQTVSFFDRSIGNPDRWCWLFGDETGSGCSSEERNPDHVYNAPATYQVRLQVGRTDGPAETFSEATRSIQVAAVDAPPCVFEVSPLAHSFGPARGNGSVKVEASAPTCAWSAESNSSFLHLLSSPQGVGNGSVQFEVDAMNTTEERTGTLTIADRTVQVTQSAPRPPPPCSYQISPDRQAFARGGGEGVVIISAPTGCDWTVDIDAKFVTLEPGSKGGSGPGAVRYRVAPHVGIETRTGTLKIAGSTFTIEQLAVELAAAFGFSPEQPRVNELVTFFDQSVGKPDVWCWDFGDGTSLDCSPSLRTVTHTYAAAGFYLVRLEVRRGDPLIVVSASTERAVPVSAGGSSTCVFEISPLLASFGPEGGTGSVTVTSSAECDWTAVSRAPFVTLSQGAGTGSGTIEFHAEENRGAEPRAGVLVIAGKLFLVEQEGRSCVTLQPESATVGGPGGEGTIQVSAPADCHWTARSLDSFLHITSGAQGSGDGTVEYDIEPNTGGEPRDGELRIGGVIFEVEQDSCLYEVSVEGGPFGPQGGVGSIVVSTQPECPWLITTEDREIFQLASSALGRSSTELQFCLAANLREARTVEVRVVNDVLRVEQAGREEGKAEGECVPDATTLCLVNGRVELRAAFRNLDGRSSAARVTPVSSKAGFFSFFSTSTLELLTKVIDGRPLNGHFWLFQGALSDVAYAVTATDSKAGSIRLLCNPGGTLRSRVDTQALPATPTD